MLDQIKAIIDKRLEGNYLATETDKERLASDLLPFIWQKAQEQSDFEMNRLYHWIKDPNREKPQTHFTAGPIRNVAREVVYLMGQNNARQ